MLEDPPRPGRIHELVLERLPDEAAATSHGLGLGTAVELGTLLGRMPEQLMIYAISGADFTLGVGLTAAVARAVDDVAVRVQGVATRL